MRSWCSARRPSRSLERDHRHPGAARTSRRHRTQLAGALVTIDAIACNPDIAKAIVDARRRLPPGRQGQPAQPSAEIERFFDDAPAAAVDRHRDVDKGHGRIEERRCRRLPTGRLDGRRTALSRRIPLPQARRHRHDRNQGRDQGQSLDRAALLHHLPAADRQSLAEAVRAHWGIENALHWVLDVTFKDDLARVRKGHGAKNMAVVRHFAVNLVRTANDKLSLKTRRKRAGWDPEYLASLLTPSPVNPDSWPWIARQPPARSGFGTGNCRCFRRGGPMTRSRSMKSGRRAGSLRTWCGAALNKPVHLVPHPALVVPIDAADARAALGLPSSRRIILTAFDFRSHWARKNAEAVLRAFADAFSQGGGIAAFLS